MPSAISATTSKTASSSRREDVLGEMAAYKLRKYYSLTPLFVFSMLLVALANNLGVMWVAIEGTTLASVFLVTFYGRETSLEAAWKYAIIGGVGLSMALFGTILTYYAAHRMLGTETLAGLNWSVLVGNAAQLDKTDHAAGVHPDSAGLRNQGRSGADAHLEAGCLQRSPGARGGDARGGVLNCALYGLVRFYILTTSCLGPQFAWQLLIAVRTAFDGNLGAVHSGAEELPAPAGLLTPSIMRDHGARAWVSADRWAPWA